MSVHVFIHTQTLQGSPSPQGHLIYSTKCPQKTQKPSLHTHSPICFSVPDQHSKPGTSCNSCTERPHENPTEQRQRSCRQSQGINKHWELSCTAGGAGAGTSLRHKANPCPGTHTARRTHSHIPDARLAKQENKEHPLGTTQKSCFPGKFRLLS